jgi:hypothetical protein
VEAYLVLAVLERLTPLGFDRNEAQPLETEANEDALYDLLH